MTDRSSNLGGTVRLEKCGDFCPRKMRTIAMKYASRETKNRNQEVKPKIMNCLLICRFITSCPDKPRKIIHHHQNVTPAGHFTKRPDRANPVHPNPGPRCKNEDWPGVGTNSPWSVKLAGLTSSAILLYISNPSSLIPLAPYHVKGKMICKMPMVILRPFENRRNFVRERAFDGFSASFNIEEMLIHNPGI